MSGQIVHMEIPADDTDKAREFWGSLFGWRFQAYPGPSEYHMTRIGEQQSAAVTNMEPGKKGTPRTSTSTTSPPASPGSRNSAARPTIQCRSRAGAGSRRAKTRKGTTSVSGRTTNRRQTSPSRGRFGGSDPSLALGLLRPTTNKDW
jgi:bleomycin resistance family protein